MGTAAAVTLGVAPEVSAATARYSKVGPAKLYYEGNKKPTSFTFEKKFHGLCDSWIGGWSSSTPATWAKPGELWSNGVYVNKPGMHGKGRAIDIARIYTQVNGKRTQVFDSRYDIWGKWSEGSAKSSKRKKYWATVASLNMYFTYVLHYLQNAEHHNHVHADNQVSGNGWGVFSTGHRSQVLSTQACLRYIWGYSTSLDGDYGPQTKAHAHDVLTKAKYGGYITTSKDHWRKFNQLAARWGNGRQTTW
jgi:hypothetical protein